MKAKGRPWFTYTICRSLGMLILVSQGMLHTTGELLLFLDADGATDIRDVETVEEALKQIERGGHGMVIGSRAHLVDSEQVAQVQRL